MSEDLTQLSALEALSGVAAGRFSAQALAQAHTARIARRNGPLKAFVHFDAPAVLAQAARIDAGACAGARLRGLPVAIKDNLDTADMPSRYGSTIYAEHRRVSDAAAVAILCANGAIVLGKAECTEFAAWPPSVTRNPLDAGRTPGGSSSGSAAAVADFLAPVALGTQTLGSVIRPASFCGVVGFKPSYGRISRVGVKPLAESLDTVGVIARNVADAELVYRVLSDDPPAKSADADSRFAVCRGASWHSAEPAARAAFDSFVDRLRASRIAADEVTLPPPFAQLATDAKIIHDFELVRGFTFEKTRHPEGLSASFREGLARAEKRTPGEYEDAMRRAEECRLVFTQAMLPYDALLTLSALGEAPVGLETTGDPIMNSPWTLLYAPCVTIPVLRGANEMPIGLQIVTPRFADNAALRAAAWLHRFSAPANAALLEA